MGSNLSKKIWEPSSSIPVTNQQQLMPPFSSTELNSSYVAACKLDVDLQTFDTSLQARTSHVINSLASGIEVRALSLESLQEITECLLEMNQEVVKVILDCKKDIWRNEEVFELVEEYFDNSLKTLDFCSSLEKCLKGVKDQHLLILLALEVEDEGNGSSYARTLEELKNFKDAGDPFTPEFFQAFQSVYRNQMVMLEKLQFKKNKLDKKLRCIHAWRKLSCIIFAATFAAVLICSVVAAAMAAPPVAAALAAATSIPLGSTGKWIDSLMKNFESAVKGQREIINCMTMGTYITIKDLDTIRVLVDRLQLDIEALMGNAEFATNDGAVRVAIDEIKKKLQGEFMKSVEDLGAQADNCSRDIRRARTVILQRIIKPPQH